MAGAPRNNENARKYPQGYDRTQTLRFEVTYSKEDADLIWQAFQAEAGRSAGSREELTAWARNQAKFGLLEKARHIMLTAAETIEGELGEGLLLIDLDLDLFTGEGQEEVQQPSQPSPGQGGRGQREYIRQKFCPKCETSKPFGAFGTDAAKSDGFTSWCKECKRNRSKKYYEQHRDPLKRRALENKRKKATARARPT